MALLTKEIAMSAHPPPVPPDNRSPKGPGEPASAPKGAEGMPAPGKGNPNTGEVGSPGNTKQNTTNKGLQQDR